MKWKRILSLGMAAVLVCSGLCQTPVYGQEISERAGGIAESKEDFVLEKDPGTENYVILGISESARDCTEVRIPAEVDGKKVTAVGSRGNTREMFADCPNLTKVTLSEGIEKIEDNVFKNCAELTEIVLPGSLKNIGENTFRQCEKLTEIVLPEGIESIGAGAFSSCGGLKEAVLPGSLERIENDAFIACTNLEHVTLSEGLKEIGQFAFAKCESLESLELPDGLEKIEETAFQECAGLTAVNFPDSLKTIAGGAFSMTNLKEVSLPQGLEAPDDNPFKYCRNLSKITMRSADGTGTDCMVENDVLLNKDKTKLITYPGGKPGEYVIPDSVTTFTMGAFYGCDGLTKLTIPAGFTKAGMELVPFDSCKSVLEFVVAEDNPDLKSKDGFILNKEGSVLYASPNGREMLVVPDGVVTMTFAAVYNREGKYLEVPSSVKEIKGNLEEYRDKDFWMIVIKDSEGERYAQRKNIPYIYKGDPLPDKNPPGPEEPTDPTPTPGPGEPTDPTPTPTPPEPEQPTDPTPTPTPPDGGNQGNGDPNCSHTYKETELRKADCRVGGAAVCVCGKCGHRYIKSTPALGHDYEEQTEKKASFKRNGITRDICIICGKEGEKTSISGVEKVKLSTTEFEWNGSVNKPSVLVRDRAGSELTEGEDYTVDFSGCKAGVGSYNVKVNFQGDYTGTVNRSYKVYPKATSITKVTRKSKGFTLKWKKQTKEADGYELQYSTSKNFTKKTTKTVLVKKTKTTSKTVSKLKANKKYYLRIRTYKTVKINNKSRKLYSGWSKTKDVKTKK